MIAIQTALMSEAKALIRYFSLKPYDLLGAYPIWGNERIFLVVTGVGKVAAGAGLTYLLAKKEANLPLTGALNIGLAGHKNLPIGSLVLAEKVSEKNSERSFFPPLLLDFEGFTKEIITLDAPSDQYEKDALFDMESAGFFQAASKFIPSEFIHSIKIISDNETFSWKNLSEKKLFSLFDPNLPSIEKVIENLFLLKEKEKKFQKEPLSEEVNRFFQKWHFTRTEKVMLQDILYKLFSLDPKINITKEVESAKKPQEIFVILKKKLQNSPLYLDKVP
jgi:adenosylhomocysteine nucleosidase